MTKQFITDIVQIVFLALLMVSLLFFAGGCMTSETSSIQSAPFSYTEGASSEDDTDYVQLSIHVLFRRVPEKGAISRFSAALGQVINDLNVIGAVTSMGTQPERMLSRLEDGTRAHLSIPVKVPLPKGKDTSIDFSIETVKEAAQKALNKAELSDDVDGIYVKGIRLKIKSMRNIEETEDNEDGKDEEDGGDGKDTEESDG